MSEKKKAPDPYLNAIREALPEAKWERVVAKAVREALAGDFCARDWLSKYLIRQPERDAADVYAEVADKLTDRLVAVETHDTEMLGRLAEAVERLTKRLDAAESELTRLKDKPKTAPKVKKPAQQPTARPHDNGAEGIETTHAPAKVD